MGRIPRHHPTPSLHPQTPPRPHPVNDPVDNKIVDGYDEDFGWQLRGSLQTDPEIILLGTATTRFEALDDVRDPFFELFRIRPGNRRAPRRGPLARRRLRGSPPDRVADGRVVGAGTEGLVAGRWRSRTPRPTPSASLPRAAMLCESGYGPLLQKRCRPRSRCKLDRDDLGAVPG